MSLQCPLCGKNKADTSLFCPECTLKLNSEYEVNVPEGLDDAIDYEVDFPEEGDDGSEYELNVLEGEDANKENLAEPEIETPDIDNFEEEKEVVIVPIVPITSDEKPKEEILYDNRSDNQKSYYEIERDKPRKRTRFYVISIFLLVLVLVAAVFIFNKYVINENLERSVWELAQRDNSIDAYLGYMDEYPHGEYVDEAQTKILGLKSNEAEAWENLRTSENTTEFTDFLQLYPQSPYERKVKNRFDSLVWESTLKENSFEGYSDYINKSNSGEITGDYIGNAQKRLVMLTQTTPVDEADLEKIKETVDGFFTGLSNISHSTLSSYLAPTISRFENSTNISNETMIGKLLLLAAKSDAKTIKFDPEITKIRYEKMGSGTYTVDVPLQKTLDGINGDINQIKGYIVHLKLDPNFKIYSFFETKPYTEAP